MVEPLIPLIVKVNSVEEHCNMNETNVWKCSKRYSDNKEKGSAFCHTARVFNSFIGIYFDFQSFSCSLVSYL